MNQLFPSISDDQHGRIVEDFLSPINYNGTANTSTPTKFQALTAVNLNLLKHSQILYSPHSTPRRPSLQLAQSLHSQVTDHEEERSSPTQPILIDPYAKMDEKTAEIVHALEFKNIEMLAVIKSSSTPGGSSAITTPIKPGPTTVTSSMVGEGVGSHHERRGSTRSDQLTHTDTTEDMGDDDDDYLIGETFPDDCHHLEEEDMLSLGNEFSQLSHKSKLRVSKLYEDEDEDLDEDIFGMELWRRRPASVAPRST